MKKISLLPTLLMFCITVLTAWQLGRMPALLRIPVHVSPSDSSRQVKDSLLSQERMKTKASHFSGRGFGVFNITANK